MKIKNFCEKYINIADGLKEQYLKDNLHIKTYIPFLTKMTLADKLAKITMLDKETGNINIKSDLNYLLFARMIIEQYTDLQVETKDFFEEYDLLNESGILGEIIQMIPKKEMNELKMICDIKREDLLQNKYENHAFISSQVERFGTLIGVILEPIMKKISEQLEHMDETDIDKIMRTLERGLKRMK